MVKSAATPLPATVPSQTLLDATRPTPLYFPVLLALATGMRRGEILALRWRNVDLDRGVLRVTESLEQPKGGLRFNAPKSGRARTITLPAFTVEELRERDIQVPMTLFQKAKGEGGGQAGRGRPVPIPPRKPGDVDNRPTKDRVISEVLLVRNRVFNPFGGCRS